MAKRNMDEIQKELERWRERVSVEVSIAIDGMDIDSLNSNILTRYELDNLSEALTELVSEFEGEIADRVTGEIAYLTIDEDYDPEVEEAKLEQSQHERLLSEREALLQGLASIDEQLQTSVKA